MYISLTLHLNIYKHNERICIKHECIILLTEDKLESLVDLIDLVKCLHVYHSKDSTYLIVKTTRGNFTTLKMFIALEHIVILDKLFSDVYCNVDHLEGCNKNLNT